MTRESNSNRQYGTAAAGKAKASSPAGLSADSASPCKLGEALLALERSLHKDCLLPEYGTEERRESWRSFVRASTGLPPPPESSPDPPPHASQPPQGNATENADTGANAANTAQYTENGSSNSSAVVAPQPSAAMAAVLLLEGMVRAPWLRAFWRFWSLPLPAPDSVRTWATVWHRLMMLRSAVRVGPSVPRTAELALFKKRRAGGGGSTRSARRGVSGVSGASGSGAVSTADGGHREVTGGRTRSTGDTNNNNNNPSSAKAGGTSATAGTSSIAKGAAAAANTASGAAAAPPSRRNLTAEIDLDAIQYTGRTRNKARVDYNIAATLSDSDDEEGSGRRRRAAVQRPPETLTREERARRRNAVRQEELEFEDFGGGSDEEEYGGRGARTRGRRGAPARGEGVRVTRAAAAARRGARNVTFSADDGTDMDVDQEEDAHGASDGDVDMVSADEQGKCAYQSLLKPLLFKGQHDFTCSNVPLVVWLCAQYIVIIALQHSLETDVNTSSVLVFIFVFQGVV